MPSPEYERVSALSSAEWDAEFEPQGMGPSRSGLAQEYHAIKNRIREAQVEGKGPGAWLERFIHECSHPPRRSRAQR